MKKLLAFILLFSPALAGQNLTMSGVSVSGGVRASVISDVVYFQDNFEAGNMTAWDGDGEGFVWDTDPPFFWHADTASPHAGTYAARCHYTNCTISSPYTAPTLGETPGGAQGVRTYFVKTVYLRPALNSGFENLIFSAEASFEVSASNLLVATSPVSGNALYYYDVYAGTTTGDANLKKQNSSAIAVGTDWTEPAGGLVDNGAYPGSFVGCGSGLTRQFERKFRVSPYVNGLNHAFIRMYVKVHTPTAGGSKNQQRKLMYVSNTVDTWRVVLTSEYSATLDKPRLRVAKNSSSAECGGTSTTPLPNDDIRALSWDTWHHVEMEVKVGASDGEIRLWIDGVLSGEATGQDIQANCTTAMQSIALGFAIDNPVQGDELRDIDDVVIAAGYVGP